MRGFLQKQYLDSLGFDNWHQISYVNVHLVG